MTLELEESFKEFWQDLLRDAEASGDPQHQCFFRIYSEIAAENGDCPDLDYAPAIREGPRGFQIDGYSIDPERGELYLAICDFRTGEELESLVQDRINTLFRRAERFFELSTGNDFVSNLEETSAAFEAAYPIHKHHASIKRVRLIIFSNARFASRKGGLEQREIGDVTLTHNILDFARFVDISNSRTGSEPIELEMNDLHDSPVRCLRADAGGEKYQSYLAAVPANLVAKVYGLYGARLLEQNVRTFLQARTKVNRGIIETVLSEPEMFFAYNNGLTATAARIDTEVLADGTTAIRAIRNLQIVNGGQTTASILYAKDKGGANLSDVYVQMKLSVVPADQLEEIVPKISRFANTQNRISEADFFSGHPFHLALERMSRSLSAPQRKGAFSASKWFYERARGQFRDKQAYLTPAQKRKFLTEYPAEQVISKTDLARVEVSFDARPHLVSKGAQKCFLEFAESIGKRWEEDQEQFDERYFREVVARVIVFRWADKMIGKAAWYREDRGYKANILTYTIACLVDTLRRERGQALDWEAIWKEQDPPADIEAVLTAMAPEVAAVIKDAPPDVKNISEYCKREVCWRAVQRRVKIERYLLDGLVSVVSASARTRSRAAQRSISAMEKVAQIRDRVGDVEALRRRARAEGFLTQRANSALDALLDETAVLPTGERSALLTLLSRLGEPESTEREEDATDQKKDWAAIIERLESGIVTETRIQMGSSGSAQVTAVRLRKQWENLNVRTEGDTVIVKLGE